MTADFLQALAAEIAALELQLRALPEFVKLSQLRSVQALYAAPNDGVGAKLPASSRTLRRDQRASYKKEHVLRAAEKTLEGRADPMPTGDLHAALAAGGIEVPGANPRNYLSALLSHDDAFESHGRAGWTLVRPTTPNSNGAGSWPAPSPTFESGSDHVATRPGHDLLNQPATADKATDGEKGASGALATTR